MPMSDGPARSASRGHGDDPLILSDVDAKPGVDAASDSLKGYATNVVADSAAALVGSSGDAAMAASAGALHVSAVETVLDALATLSMPPQDPEHLRQSLLAGTPGLLLDSLGLVDSLSAMEFCIHLELAHGVVITPDQLEEMADAQALLLAIQASPREV